MIRVRTDNSVFYREVYDWYIIVMRYYLSIGMTRKEARAAAYDSVELRFNIGYSRARSIVREESRVGGRLSQGERNQTYQNNLQIINLINIVNGEYSGHGISTGRECKEK